MGLHDRQRTDREDPRADPSTRRPDAQPVAVQQILSLQQGAGNAAVARMLAARTTGTEAAPGSGPAPLAPPTAARMGAAFGRSFHSVRVHPDSPKAGGRVLALTEGRDVHFQAGAYRPGDASGDWLIAHELAHVVQQDGASSEPSPAPALEQEADAAADAVSAGAPPAVRRRAPSGRAQRFEAWEHRELGDAYGGAGRAVTLECGLTLTYGQVVALSGDFYRSPEALMRAPAKEIEAILAIMRREAEQAHSSATGAPTHEQINANNADYELATTGSRGARHHSHTGEALLGEGEGEDHAGHEHGPSGSHDGARGDHGLVLDDEHVEDAGPGAVHDVPSADAAFLKLAADNSSHFSPENIRHNYIPKHQLAIDYAAVAYRERTGGSHPAAPEAGGEAGPAPSLDDPARTPGAAPSARSGELPSTGAGTAGAPGVTDASSAGPATPAGNARFADGGPGERQEAMAWMSNGFADHYITDAFASGHLVSGNVGRSLGSTFFEERESEIRAALNACATAEYPHAYGVRQAAIAIAWKAVQSNLGNMALLAVHDELNEVGMQVKNAAGTEWRTFGDANLASSPETRKQAEMASKASRDAIQETLDSGRPATPFRALDHIPDVARIGPGEYRPIAEFAEDPATFHPLFEEVLLTHDPGMNRFYRSLKGNAVPMAKMKARVWVKQGTDWALGKLGGIWEGATNLGSRALAKAKSMIGLSSGEGEGDQPQLDSGEQLIKDAADLALRAQKDAQEATAESPSLDPRLKRIYDLVTDAAEQGEPYEEMGQTLLEEFVEDAQTSADSTVKTVEDTATEAIEDVTEDAELEGEEIPDFTELICDAEDAEPYAEEGVELAEDVEAPEVVLGVEAAKAAKPYVVDAAKAAGSAGAADAASTGDAAGAVESTGTAEPAGAVEPAEPQAIGEIVDDSEGIAERARNALSTFAEWADDVGPDALPTGADVAVAGRDGARAATEFIVEEQEAAVESVKEGLSEWAGPVVGEGFDVVTTPQRWVRDKTFETGNAFLDYVVELTRGSTEAITAAQADAQSEAPEALPSGTLQSGTRRVHALGRQTYAHGGFMGAAGEFMNDPEWNDIFSRLMPADFRQADQISDIKALMAFLENNPVLSAYGSARHMAENEGGAEGAADPSQTAPLPLEWDVWLPQGMTERPDLSSVRIAHGGLATTVLQGANKDLPIGITRPDVSSRPSPVKWMELFAQAIAMHRAGADLPLGGRQSSARRDEAMEQVRAATVAEDALALTAEFLKEPGGLIVDVKSTYSTPEDIATFVRMLQSRSINVIGVGTFEAKQLAAVPEGVRGVRFFNGVNGLEKAANNDELAVGGEVMFNAGGLLTSSIDVLAGQTTWHINRDAFQRVAAIKDGYGVHIGLYVQESEVSPQAVETIIELANTQPDVFDRGFAYGNVDRSAETTTSGSGMGLQEILDVGDKVKFW